MKKMAESSKKAKAIEKKQEVVEMKNISTVVASDTTVSTVAAEAMVTVTTAAQDIATKGEIEAAKAAAKATKKAAKEAAEAEKKARWIKNAGIDENGQYLVVIEKDYANYDQHPGWNPCYYIVTTNFDMTRIGLKFAVELLEQGKAVEVTKEQVHSFKSNAKAAKKAEAEKAKAETVAADSSKAA